MQITRRMDIIRKLSILSLLLVIGCNNIQSEKRMPFQNKTTFFCKNDTAYFYLDNPLKCPMRYILTSTNSETNDLLINFQPILLEKESHLQIKIPLKREKFNTIKVKYFLGDLKAKVTTNKLSLPFPKNREYMITQGYNGNFSHREKYAIDFALKMNDTICAADDGYVVGVDDNSNIGGNEKKFINHSNFIDIYHPKTNLFTGYGHLAYKSSFVKIGDFVKSGQPIGLAGNTGYTNGTHLHFEANIPVNNADWKTTKVEFVEGYIGENMKMREFVRK